MVVNKAPLILLFLLNHTHSQTICISIIYEERNFPKSKKLSQKIVNYVQYLTEKLLKGKCYIYFIKIIFYTKYIQDFFNLLSRIIIIIALKFLYINYYYIIII